MVPVMPFPCREYFEPFRERPGKSPAKRKAPCFQRAFILAQVRLGLP